VSVSGLRSIENIFRLSSQLENLNLSQNSLADIRPLAQAPSLKHLNLADNSISDLRGISGLLQLEMLDLSNNCISSCESLEPLAALPQLHELNLAGNVVCSSIGYPALIFSYLPTLKHLDGLTREQLLWAEPDEVASKDSRLTKQPNLSAALDLRPKVLDGPRSNKSQEYLQAQVLAMEHAFELQEKSLAGNAEAGIKEHSNFSDIAADLHQTPYLKILQLWRHQAHHSMTQLCVARRTIREQAAELKLQRSSCADAVRDSQLNALSWRERTLAADQKASAAEDRLIDAGKALEKEREQSRELETEALAARKSMSGLRSYLSSSVSQMQEHTVGALLTVKKAAAKLDEQKARLAAAAERVTFAAVLVAQREVTLRNSIAMQAISHRDDENIQNIEDLVGDDQDVSVPIKSIAAKVELALRPEAEALLNTLFRSLDTSNSGLVSRELLLLCISESVESNAQSSDVSSLVALVKDVLGLANWTKATAGLRSLKCAEITWGEFLHQLLCPSRTAPGSPLDYIERSELDRAGAWGDIQWGTIPLDFQNIPVDMVVKSELPVTEAEVHRLAGERAGLLKTIQGLTRTMQRRAEVCKAHFLRETRAISLQNSRLQEQVATLRESNETAARRHDEVVLSHASQKERLEAKLHAIEIELKSLRDRELERTVFELEQADNTVLVEKSKYQQLGKEYDLMQQEIIRKEILNKGLQRDSRRVAESLASVMDEKEKLEGELAACERQLAALAKEHESKVDKIQVESQKTLNELRAQLDTSERLLQEAKVVSVEEAAQIVKTGNAGVKDGSVATNNSVDRSAEDAVMLGLRSEMEDIRNLKTNDFGGGQSSVYAAHLEKLLRLAEDAIGH